MKFGALTRTEASVIVEVPDGCTPSDFLREVYDELDGADFQEICCWERGEMRVAEDADVSDAKADFRVTADGEIVQEDE